MLDPTELRLYESENEVIRFAQGEGYLQVGFNRALMLVEEAHRPDDLDRAELQDKLKRAEQELEAAEEGSEAERVAERGKRRWEAFLAVLEEKSR
jgi:F-type H+-transporting ATPase subunit epsilon